MRGVYIQGNYLYCSVPLIRPLRKYALPLFFAQVSAQGSLIRYNASLGEHLLEYLTLHVCNFADRLSDPDGVVTVDAYSTSHLAATLP